MSHYPRPDSGAALMALVRVIAFETAARLVARSAILKAMRPLK